MSITPTYINVVRYRLIPGSEQNYFDAVKKFEAEGLLTRHIAKTGSHDYCFVGLWESEEAIAKARSKMIAHLDEVRDFMQELSADLGVTDPVSGPIVA